MAKPLPVGLVCPKCGEQISTSGVATSYPIEGGGHRRTRFCGKCHAEVATIEWVVGADCNLLVVAGLDRGEKDMGRPKCGPGTDASLVRQLVRRLGGKVAKL